jgi:hypothetical protein
MKAKRIYNAFLILRNVYKKVYDYIKTQKKYKKYENEILELINNYDKVLTIYKTITTTATPADLEGDERLNFIVVSKNKTLKEYLKERRLNETDPAKKRDFYVYYEITYEYCIKTREVEIIKEQYLKIYE